MTTRRGLRWATLALLASLAALMAGCGSVSVGAPVVPPLGIIYTDVSAPLLMPPPGSELTDLSTAEVHTENFQIPYSYFRLISLSWGEAALQQAIRESGFREVLYADYHLWSILSVYSTFTVNVYGRS